MAEFITLTGPNGPEILVNLDQVSHVRERGNEDKPTQIVMANGLDFEVAESFAEVSGLLSAS